MHMMRAVTDIALFKIIDNNLCVLIVQRAKDPYVWKRCLPWWFINAENETVEQTAYRVLKTETGISHAYLEQLHVFSSIHRDPRWRAIWVWCMWIITTGQKIIPGASQKNVMFCPIKNLPSLVFDHQEIVAYAHKVILNWAENGSIIKHFLPPKFTLSHLQTIYEILLSRTYEKRNFRRVIEKIWLKPTKQKERWVSHRPAIYYMFRK